MTTGNADVDRWLTAVAAGAPPLNGAQIETISKLMSRKATRMQQSGESARSTASGRAA